MLHKGKLQAALQRKEGQFVLYDTNFGQQLEAYRQVLETLSQAYPSSYHLASQLPPDQPGMPPAGARASIEFDRWLAVASQNTYPGPVVPFGRTFANHEQMRKWAECIEGVTTIAVDGSQLLPWKDASIPVALVQAGLFINPHQRQVPYIKDVRMEVLTPEEIMEQSNEEHSDPDNYPFSEIEVTLRRHLLEIDTLCQQMEKAAENRTDDSLIYSPVVFFDGSLIVSFALTMPQRYRERYIEAATRLLRTSEECRVPLIGYIDTSYARDITSMLYMLDQAKEIPTLSPTKRIHDALLWFKRLSWGDRTPAMICSRGDILQEYGQYRDKVAFCYLQTSARRPPARLEFPRWLLDENILEPVLDAVRAEVVIGNGYPYAIESADVAAVITMADRQEFYAQFQIFMEKQGVSLTFSNKSLSKGRRR